MDQKTLIRDRILKALLLACIPLICCILYCFGNKCSLNDIFLPNGQWNDELIYYMEMKGIDRYGIPRGYFGYNESRALYGPFSVWSPVLFVFWIIFSLFGSWGVLSPIVSNILIMSVSMFILGALVNPNRKQVIKIIVCYISLVAITRFTLSGLVESSVYGLLIVYIGLIYALMREEKTMYFYWIYGICALLTIMRPYYMLLFFFPSVFCKKKNLLMPSVSGILCVALNFIISSLFCADFFEPLLDTSWITPFFNDGIFMGLKETLYLIYKSVLSFGNLIVHKYTTVQGNWAIQYLSAIIIIAFNIFQSIQKRNRQSLLIYIYSGVCFCLFFFACTFLFDIPNGSKHMFELVVIFIFLFSLLQQHNKEWLAFIFVLWITFGASCKESYTWKLPIVTTESYESFVRNKEEIGDQIFITEELSYDNSVIWVLSDLVNGKEETFPYQYMYLLPDGIGINLCTYEYTKNNMDNLQCKYMMIWKQGELAELCKHKEKLWEDEKVILYKLR